MPRDDGACFAPRDDECGLRADGDGSSFGEEIATVAALLRNDGNALVMTVERVSHRERSVAIS